MGVFSACFFSSLENRAASDARGPHRRHHWRPCRRFFSRLIHRGRRNQRHQEQVEQPALKEIHQASEPLAQVEQEQLMDQIDHAVEPLTQTQEERIETSTMRPLHFDMMTPHFTILDSESVLVPHGTSRTGTIHPKVQFMIFCFFFLLCTYANMQQEAHVQDLVQNVKNKSSVLGSTVPILDIISNTSSPSPDLVTSELDKEEIHYEWSSVKNILSVLFVGLLVACYLFRESICGAIMLMSCILTLFEVRGEVRWLRWLNSR